MAHPYWQDRRVFVTGASGLLGGWLVEALLKRKADVLVLLRDWAPHSRLIASDLLTRTKIVRGDLSSLKKLSAALSENEIQNVFHLAAQTLVPVANRNPISTFESNVAGTWNLLEACRQVQSVSSIVVASSDKAYGESEKLPYQEDMPLQPIFPYDVSKACADLISISYAKSVGLPVAVTRFGNLFGGGDLNWNRLIPGTIRSIVRKQSPMIRSDGSLIRDYVYVKDAVNGYLNLSEALDHKAELRGEVFNFSSGETKTALELASTLLKLKKSELKPTVLGNNTGEIRAQTLDSTKALKLLKWKPKYSLEEGLRETLDWYSNYFARSENEVDELLSSF